MSMLGLALKAGVPLIRVYTSDLVNLQDVLRHVAGKTITEWAAGRGGLISGLHYAVTEVELTVALYGKLVDQGGSLVLVNQGEDSPLPFNAGEVPVPKEMVYMLLAEIVPKAQVPALAACCSGLTLKAISEIARMVMAQDKALTPKGLMAMRSALAGKMQGLAQVDPKLPLYLCPGRLAQWVGRNKKYFLDAPDERLVPRGILLSGEAGVGKTSAAKFIAESFEVPLYRLDLSSTLGKYVGESEGALARLLNTLDQEGSCVLLMDEVEKLFAERDDSGVTSRLLAQMLWWLSEHTSRVLTVMTTNDVNALPKEMYRAGRIDMRLEISPLAPKEAISFGLSVAQQFWPKLTNWQKALLTKTLSKEAGKHVAHAKVVQTVYDLIKEGTLGELKL